MINEIKTKLIDKIHFDASPQEITNSMSIWMNANEGISFPSPQIPSLLGYNAKLDENGEYHIGYKMIPSFDASYEGNELYESHFPYDLSSGTSLIFVYIDIFHYQTVGDAKAPLLRVIDSNRRIKNGSACSIEPNHRKNFTDLDYKKLFTSSVQSISVQLRRDTGRLVPFAGTGKVVLTSSALIENQWNSIMQSKLHFLISLDTTDNAAVDLALWLLVLVVLLYRWHDGLFENF